MPACNSLQKPCLIDGRPKRGYREGTLRIAHLPGRALGSERIALSSDRVSLSSNLVALG